MKPKQLSIRKILSENKQMKRELSRGKTLLINTDNVPDGRTIQDCIDDFKNNNVIVLKGKFEAKWIDIREPNCKFR